MFFQYLTGDHTLDHAELDQLFREVCDNIQRKAWDCDLDATRTHYQAMIDQILPPETEPEPEPDQYGRRYHYYESYAAQTDNEISGSAA